MKLSLRKSWLWRFIPDLSPSASGASSGIVNNGISKYGHIDRLPIWCRIACLIFAFIGALWTLHWLASFLCSAPMFTTMLQSVHTDEISSNQAMEECLPNHVIDDLTERMQMLELAFKEQVFARETITREITDQSDVYETLGRQLEEYVQKIDNISSLYADLQLKYSQLADRVYTDELFGIAILVVSVIQLIYLLRPRILTGLERVSEVNPALAQFFNQNKLEKRNSSSNPGTPRHSARLLNEICVVCFQRENINGIVSKLTESMLHHLDAVKLSNKPFYGVYSSDDLRTLPHVKLYVILVDLESRGLYINSSDKDLLVSTFKLTKSFKAQCVVVITNDEGSRSLTAHSQYNTSIRIIKTCDCLQELAADGKLFSMWQEMTSHQLSHLRRFVKTVLNAKLVMR